MFFDDDLEEEVVDTKLTKVEIIPKEENIVNNKKCRLTPLSIPEQEYMFEQKLKEAEKLKALVKNEDNNKEVVKIETNNNGVVTIKEKKKACLIIIEDENSNKIKELENRNEKSENNDKLQTESSLQGNFKSFMNKRKVSLLQ